MSALWLNWLSYLNYNLSCAAVRFLVLPLLSVRQSQEAGSVQSTERRGTWPLKCGYFASPLPCNGNYGHAIWSDTAIARTNKQSIKSDSESVATGAEPKPNLPRRAAFCPNLTRIGRTPYRNRCRTTSSGWGQRGPGSIAAGGGLLVSILEGGRRRLLAGVVGDEGVKAVDRHFLSGHHHPANRRGILRGGAASSPARARAWRGAATASGGGRWGERRLEGQGSGRCVCFFSQYPSAWGFCLCGRGCPFQWTVLPSGFVSNSSSAAGEVQKLLHCSGFDHEKFYWNFGVI